MRIETAIVDAAQRGDESAMRQLLANSQINLRRYAKSVCASDDAEEAVQDALWLLYEKLGALRTVAAFGGWLYQILRRACLRLARQRASSERRSVELHDEIAAAPRDEDLRLDVARALGTLPGQFREVIMACDILGESADEVAAKTGISIPAIRSRLHRARRMLREALESSSSQPQTR